LVLGRELADHLLFSSQRVVPAVLAEHGFEFAHPTVEDGLRAAVAS
jgi:NAD dependent epimerase/dehydratase family enzyme